MIKKHFSFLIVALFLLPFGAALYLLSEETGHEIAFTEKERAGARYHQALFETLISLSRRDTPEALYAQMERVDALENEARAMNVYSGWEIVRQEITAGLDHKRLHAGQDNLLMFMRQVANRSNLVLDPEMESYFMMQIMTDIVPDIVVNLDHVRDIGFGMHASEHVGILKQLAERYQYAFSVIEDTDPENISKRIEKEVRAVDRLNDTIRALQASPRPSEKVLLAESGEAVAAFAQVYRQLAAHLDWHLNERIEGYQAYRLKMILLLLGAFGMTVGLFVAVQRGRMRLEAEKTNQLLSSIVESTDDAIVSETLDGVVTSWNKGAEIVSGYSASDAVGKHIRFMLPKDRLDEEMQMLDQIRRDGAVKRLETQRVKKSGEMIHISLTISPIRDGKGRIVGISKVARDITERKRAEQRITQLAQEMEAKNRELAEAHHEADRANRMKSEFLATMSHEIRTPMNGIIGMTTLLADTDLSPLQRQRLDIIRQSGEALLEIINDILDISKIEAGKMTLDPVAFNLHYALLETAELFAPRCHDKGVELVVRYAPGAPEWLMGDPGRIRQILINLIGNAAKFTEQGHVLVNVEVERQRDAEAVVRVEVIDSGIGISKDAQKKLFENFTQADMSNTRKYGGTGLGLAICRRLVDMMSGSLGVTSEIGKGSTFWFTMTLPLADPGVTSHGQAPAALPVRTRVLLVDSVEIGRGVVQEYLQADGLRCDMTASGKAALAALAESHRAGDPYALVLFAPPVLDMDSRAFARAVAAHEAYGSTPLVLLTAVGYRGEAKEIEEQGFTGYLTRPFHRQVLGDVMARSVLAKREGQAGLVTRHTVGYGRRSDGERGTGGSVSLSAHILVAEDNKINQVMVRQMLEQMGCRVEIAEDGQKAVEAHAKGAYDLILMDCMMPAKDGYEATRAIRQAEAGSGKRIPIIALTANVLSGEREKCLAAGMDEYLSKPVKRYELQEALLKWLKPSAPAALDSRVLRDFMALVGAEASMLLHGHSESVVRYLRDADAALAAEEWMKLADAVHPLKSASQQIGAFAVYKLAAEVERIARKPGADTSSLGPLLQELQREQERVDAAIRDLFSEKN